MAILSGIEAPIANVSPQLGEQPVLWDCHLGNTLIYNGQVSGFVDCDHINIGPRICDLGNFAANLVIRVAANPGRAKPWLRHLPCLLEGYASISPLTSEEQTAFPLGILFFLLVILDHYQMEGPQELAVEALDSAWWVYDNLHRIRTAVQQASPPISA